MVPVVTMRSQKQSLELLLAEPVELVPVVAFVAVVVAFVATAETVATVKIVVAVATRPRLMMVADTAVRQGTSYPTREVVPLLLPHPMVEIEDCTRVLPSWTWYLLGGG